MRVYLVILTLCSQTSVSHAELPLAEGIYCGLEVCYDILGVTRDAPKAEIRRTYRQLSVKAHPDKFIAQFNDGQISQEEFDKIQTDYRIINVAYETIKDQASRDEYNHYLDHPEDRYYNYYRYYSRKFHNKVNVDIRLVIVGFLLCWSLFQWSGWSNTYTGAINYMMHDAKFRNQAKTTAIERGLLDIDGKLPKKVRKEAAAKHKNKPLNHALKEEIEIILRNIIEENIDIRGGCGKPKITDVAIFQVLFVPYYIYIWFTKTINWYYRRLILKSPLNDDEKWIMINKNLKCKSHVEFEYLKDKKGKELWEVKAWIPENCYKFQEDLKEAERLKNMDSGRNKQYRRYMKKHGKTTMTFNENDDGEWAD